MFLIFFFGKTNAKSPFLFFLYLVKFYQLFKMLKQKNLKTPLMLDIAQFVKSGFLHFGNTKTEVDFFLQNLPKLKIK
jgi:hypothetical protein